jgi:hypothetical protein
LFGRRGNSNEYNCWLLHARGNKRSGERFTDGSPEAPPALPDLAGRARRSSRCRSKLSSQGVGSTLLADAALRVLKGDTKAFALIVEAKGENAVAFYQLQGFRPFASRPMSLFLPLGTAKKGIVDVNSP